MRKDLIPTLPDFILIEWLSRFRNDKISLSSKITEAIDNELQARYESIREELEPYANELPF
jgi:hypothetical protein